MDEDSIASMELLQQEMWPARNIERINGWILSENGGITWRANSTYPYGDMRPERADEAIEKVIAFYRKHGCSPAFKMTKACSPPDLDERLEARGFVKFMPTHVQTRGLVDYDFSSPPAIRVQITEELTEDWLETQRVDERYHGSNVLVLKDILKRLPGRSGYAIVRNESGVIGVGLGVVHKNWLALYSVRVVEEHRRKGVGEAISRGLTSWGRRVGAQNVFLQVEADKTKAIRLYEKLGFRTAYSYWYRALDLTTG
ncbi:MAG: GNAT family N-acetyltransferase [Candidatus Thorarchaeota archaeon]